MSIPRKLIRTASITAAVAAATLALTARPASAGVTASKGLLSVGAISDEWTSHREAGYDFGVGYHAEIYGLAANHAIAFPGAPAGIVLRASGELEIPATVFDESFNLFKVWAEARVSTLSSPTIARAEYELDVVGAVIKAGTHTLPMSQYPAQYCGTLAGTDASFSFAGIGIDVDASVAGCMHLKVAASADLAQQTLTVTTTPSSSIDASLGVGFSAGQLGSVSIHGGINLFDLALPMPLNVALQQTGAQITESGSLQMRSLEGDVSVEATLLGATLFNEEIFGWDGIELINQPVFNQSQSFSW